MCVCVGGGGAVYRRERGIPGLLRSVVVHGCCDEID